MCSQFKSIQLGILEGYEFNSRNYNEKMMGDL